MVTKIKRGSGLNATASVADEPEVMSPLGYMLLIVLFFLGFLMVIGFNRVFSNLIDDLGVKSANEQARLFIGETITQGIKDIEMDIYRMATTIGVLPQERIEKQLLKKVAKLEHDLLVLKDGGTVQQVLYLNVEGMEQMVRTVDFKPDAQDKRYVMELIELGPHLDQIKVKASQLRGLLEKREDYRENQNREGLFLIEKDIKGYLKKSPPFFPDQ